MCRYRLKRHNIWYDTKQIVHIVVIFKYRYDIIIILEWITLPYFYLNKIEANAYWCVLYKIYIIYLTIATYKISHETCLTNESANSLLFECDDYFIDHQAIKCVFVVNTLTQPYYFWWWNTVIFYRFYMF